MKFYFYEYTQTDYLLQKIAGHILKLYSSKMNLTFFHFFFF